MQLTFRIDHSTRSAVSADPRFLVAGDLYDPLVLDFSSCPRDLVDAVDVGGLRLDLRRDSAAGAVVASVAAFTRVPSRRFLCAGVLTFATAGLLAWWEEVRAKMLAAPSAAGSPEAAGAEAAKASSVPRSDAVCWMEVRDSKTAYVACTVPVVLCGFSERDSLDDLLDSAEERLEGFVADATAQASAAETAKDAAVAAQAGAEDAKDAAVAAQGAAETAKAGAEDAKDAAVAAQGAAETAKAGAEDAKDAAVAAQGAAETAKAGAEDAKDAAVAAQGAAETAKAGAEGLLSTKLDVTYESGGFTEAHSQGSLKMTGPSDASSELKPGGLTLGAVELAESGGRLTAGGSEVALASEVRSKLDMAVYGTKRTLEGVKVLLFGYYDYNGALPASTPDSAAQYSAYAVRDPSDPYLFTADIAINAGEDVLHFSLSFSESAASPWGVVCPTANCSFTYYGEPDKDNTTGYLGAYSDVGVPDGIPDADGRLDSAMHPVERYQSSVNTPFGQYYLRLRLEGPSYVGDPTGDVLATASSVEKVAAAAAAGLAVDSVDVSPTLTASQDGPGTVSLVLVSSQTTERAEVSVPPSSSGGAGVRLSAADRSTASLTRKDGLVVDCPEYRFDESTGGYVGAKSAYGPDASVGGTLSVTGASTLSSASVGGALSVTGDVRVPSVLLYCGDDKKYHRLTAAKMADGSFALGLEQEGEA